MSILLRSLARNRAYTFCFTPSRQPDEAEVALRDVIQKAALARRTYGYRRLTAFMQRAGIAVGEGVEAYLAQR